MDMLPDRSFVDRLNDWGRDSRAFLFVIDFEGRKPLAWLREEIPDDVRFMIPGGSPEGRPLQHGDRGFRFHKEPMAFPAYRRAFDRVMQHLLQGNSYLVNLTFPTRIETNLDLDQIYEWSRAPYKLLVSDSFVVFSPEPFVRIGNGLIRSFPMKGTIDASLPDAEQRVLNDRKEMAEHFTIVDLIRNDLSKVAGQVEVARFRYVERLRVHDRDLLQISSEIRGILPPGYPGRIGDILFELLPAGSVSGAPKKRTLEIISEAETGPRGYYTGVFGYFDGHNLESAVMIRYIERTESGLVYRSGGGITHMSRAEDEYAEMVKKVYLALESNSEIPCRSI
jgi:para-aminobenzoate synthetase component 1